MSEMVERVARAICAKTNIAMEGVTEVVLDNPDYVIPGNRRFDKTDTPRWKLYVDQSRAAIEAMREPTDPMIHAGEALEPDTLQFVPDYWRAMIDAALTLP
jgi:hypothetical protein